MAKFELELPLEVMKDLEKINGNTEKIFGEMTRAGAEVLRSNVLGKMPSGLKKLGLQNYIRISKVYKTPSDDGINTKVMFVGYVNGDPKKPAPLIANAFEYGTSARYTLKGQSRGSIKKTGFFRRSFNKGQIEQAMINKQKEISGGLLTNE